MTGTTRHRVVLIVDSVAVAIALLVVQNNWRHVAAVVVVSIASYSHGRHYDGGKLGCREDGCS